MDFPHSRREGWPGGIRGLIAKMGGAEDGGPLLPLLTQQAQPSSEARLLLLLTCFGCICEFRSTNGAMNRYVPVGKAQLKFFHRPLSSLVQRGRAERKTKEQEQERGENREKEKERRREREGARERERE